VVAPMSAMVPASTCGRNASCCALLKRWISSQKRMVRRPSRAAASPPRDDLAHAGNALGDGAEVARTRRRALGDDARERRLAGARRPPEDDAADGVLLDQLAQRLAGPEQVLLADVLVERARPHARGERRVRAGGAARRRPRAAAPPARRCRTAAPCARRLAEQVQLVAAISAPGSSRLTRKNATTPANRPPCTSQLRSCCASGTRFDAAT
jgi:hypothetical protein